MKDTIYKVTAQMAVLYNSMWTKSLKIGDTFQIIGEVGSFYKIKSPNLEESTIACSILKSSLENKTEKV